MPKKNKLNSKNPKYKKEDEQIVKIGKEFVHEVKGVKVSKIHYI